MRITEKTLKTLEFDKIREMLADSAGTAGAREKAMMLTPSDDIDEINRRLSRTTDAKRLTDIKGQPSFGEIHDISDSCERAVKGATLTTRELLDVADVLRVSRRLYEYIRVNKLFDTSLDADFYAIATDKHLEDSITRSILSEEMIADDASPELADIRRKIKRMNVKIRDMLQSYTQSSEHSKYLQDNIVTMRNGRFVIPVKVECRNDVKGLVHDTSASGATLFVEPMAVVEANNELREYSIKEEREIERILAELSASTADFSTALISNYRIITELAYAFACAEFSYRIKGVCPEINTKKRVIDLKRARHPLISKDKVVPIDVSLGEGYDTLIITGPNTGGKTVTLKTLGLFALMAQAGLHIPADEHSSVCIFDRVLADIGDEQSIEASLSTFGSHMVNIVSIMDEITENSLVLFDELGVGTDPVEGAALAVSIIEKVRATGSLCAATTHYAELKIYALNTEGVKNASCEFDIETLKPTYKLIIGAPGKSNAFAISEKIGLSPEIVGRAKNIVSAEDRRFEDVIEKLEKMRIELEAKKDEAEKLRAEYEKYRNDAERIYREKTEAAEKEAERARKRAIEMINSARASSEYVFEQLDKAKKAKDSEKFAEELEERRREVRRKLRESSDDLDPVEISDGEYVLPRDLVVGDKVIIANIGKRAIVTRLPDKKGLVGVRTGQVDMRTSIDNIRLDDGKDDKKPEKKVKSNTMRSAVVSFSPEIDLRGKTGDEAWYLVDKYLDDAMMASVQSVRLIHGKGTGALKNALWQYLKLDNRIKSFRIGAFGEGDTGVTVVELK